MIFPWSRKIINLCLKWHILRKYCSIAEVTFKSDIFGSFDTLTPAPSFKLAFVAYSDRSNPTFPFPQEYSQGSVKYWLFLIVYLLYWFNYWMLLNHNSFIFRRVCHLFPLLLFQSWTLFIFSYATHFHKMYQQLTCKYGKVFFLLQKLLHNNLEHSLLLKYFYILIFLHDHQLWIWISIIILNIKFSINTWRNIDKFLIFFFYIC